MLSWTRQSERPGAGLESYAACLGLAVLALNDHVLKGADVLPGWLTGKLSDFAGLLFFPLLLQAGLEIVSWAMGRYRGPSNPLLLNLSILTALVFTSAQCTELGAQVYSWAVGWIQWLPGYVLGLSSEPLRPAVHYADVSDTLGLVSLGFAYVSGVWTGQFKGRAKQLS